MGWLKGLLIGALKSPTENLWRVPLRIPGTGPLPVASSGFGMSAPADYFSPSHACSY